MTRNQADLDKHNSYMRLALQVAKQTSDVYDEVPIGAVLVDPRRDEVLVQCGNQVEQDKDPTAHAEMVAIRQAAKFLDKKRLPGLDLYITLEPCTMCAGALAHARIERIFIAAIDPKGGGVYHGARFFEQNTCHHRPEVIHFETFEDEAGEMLRQFFKEKRRLLKRT